MRFLLFVLFQQLYKLIVQLSKSTWAKANEQNTQESIICYLPLGYVNVSVNNYFFAKYDIPLGLKASILSSDETVVAVLGVNKLIHNLLL